MDFYSLLAASYFHKPVGLPFINRQQKPKVRDCYGLVMITNSFLCSMMLTNSHDIVFELLI